MNATAPIVIPLAPDAPTPPGYVPVAHKTGIAAVLPDPSCNRCKGSPRYRYTTKVAKKHGEDPQPVVNCCRCVSRRLYRALAANLPRVEVVEGPPVTGAEALVAPAVERDHDAEERRLTSLRAQLAGVEGRIAEVDAAHAGELARIDERIGQVAREHQDRVERAADFLADGAALLDRAGAAQERADELRSQYQRAADELRAHAADLLRRAAEILEAAQRQAAEIEEEGRVAAVRAARAWRQEGDLQAEIEAHRQRGLAILAERAKVVHRHERRTRNARGDAARLRAKLDAMTSGSAS